MGDVTNIAKNAVGSFDKNSQAPTAKFNSIIDYRSKDQPKKPDSRALI